MIKLVAFDWNGTLLADTATVVRVDNFVYQELGLPPITLARFRDTYDTPLLDYFSANGVNRELFLKSYKKTDKIFHEKYETLALKARTRSGVKKNSNMAGEKRNKEDYLQQPHYSRYSQTYNSLEH